MKTSKARIGKFDGMVESMPESRHRRDPVDRAGQRHSVQALAEELGDKEIPEGWQMTFWKPDRDKQAELETELIRSQTEAHTGEDGSRVCSRCGRALSGNDFFVSMMGHGLFCKNEEECVAKAIEVLRDDSSDMDVKCERCRQGLRGRGFRVVSRGTRLVCENFEECDEGVADLIGA